MRKIKFNNEPSEIHFEEINEGNVIRCTKEGKYFSAMMNINSRWHVRYVDGSTDSRVSLSDLIKLMGKNCEFHVLD